MTQVYIFNLSAQVASRVNTSYETLDHPDNAQSSPHFDLDDRLIDFDMLVAEPAEADRIYQELKERALRRKRIDAKEKQLEEVINDEIEEDDDTPESIKDLADQIAQGDRDSFRKAQSANKILSILEKSSLEERLDFTNGLLNFVNKIEKRNIDGLLPALKLLASDAPEVRKALLN